MSGMSEEECDRLEEEDEQEERKSRNVLLDLHNCFEQVTLPLSVPSRVESLLRAEVAVSNTELTLSFGR